MESFANDFSKAIWSDIEESVVSRVDEESKDNELTKLTQDPSGYKEDINDQEKLTNEALFEELIKEDSQSSINQDKTMSRTPSEGESSETDWQKEEIPKDIQFEEDVRDKKDEIIPLKELADGEDEMLLPKRNFEERINEDTRELLLDAAKDEWRVDKNVSDLSEDNDNLKEKAKNIVAEVISSSQREISKKPITQCVWSAEFQQELKEKISSVPAVLFLTLIFISGVLGSIFEIGVLPFAFCVTVAFLCVFFSYQFFTNCDN